MDGTSFKGSKYFLIKNKKEEDCRKQVKYMYHFFKLSKMGLGLLKFIKRLCHYFRAINFFFPIIQIDDSEPQEV